jgi:hypothetical protein
MSFPSIFEAGPAWRATAAAKLAPLGLEVGYCVAPRQYRDAKDD